MARHVVCQADEVALGKITPASLGRYRIVLTRLPSGEIRAISARCPHQGAALEHGSISGMTRSDKPNEITFCNYGEIIRCPWHGFEYSLLDGRAVVASQPPSSLKLRIFDARVEDGNVVVIT